MNMTLLSYQNCFDNSLISLSLISYKKSYKVSVSINYPKNSKWLDSLSIHPHARCRITIQQVTTKHFYKNESYFLFFHDSYVISDITQFLTKQTYFMHSQKCTPLQNTCQIRYLYKRQPHKIFKHTQAIRRQHPNCLSVFDHFVGLALKGLTTYLKRH